MSVTLPVTAAETAYQGFALPHRRQEDWRWTDLRQLLDQAYPPAHGTKASVAEIDRLIATDALAPFARASLVFVDGAFDKARSKLPATGAITLEHLTHGAPPSKSRGAYDDPLANLNDRFCRESLRLTVKAGTAEDAPIALLFVSTGHEVVTTCTRAEIIVEKGASATLLETHIGGKGAYVASSLIEASIGDDARLDRVKIAEDGQAAIHLASFHVKLGTQSILNDFTLTQGAKATRQQSSIKVAGAYLLNGKQHADTKITVDHAVPHCTSRELFKCVMDDHARGIFQGKVVVRKDAQKTDGKQSSNALLLSETAEFDAKPELEIFADDVVCGHGATSGSLNEDYLFYLRARGIPEDEAKSLLIAAFASEAFDEVAHEGVRESLTQLTEGWLTTRKHA
jgi:Fe-S cluster assembly protein SufD